MSSIKIKSALISVFYKDGLEDIIKLLIDQGVTIYSTGGTQAFVESLGGQVVPVESITGYPSILDGRVKTLHPKVFGGILAIRNEDHLGQLSKYEIPPIDLVIVDLYPFEETLAKTSDEDQIVEKIDIGGIALIRGAAKNFNDVVIIPSKNQYSNLYQILKNQEGASTLEQRKSLAKSAFEVSSHYDTAIFKYFANGEEQSFKHSILESKSLRYGENPHQVGNYFGDMQEIFEIFGGKELSYNNLVDVDAAVNLIREFKDEEPTIAILKHTNSCGIATKKTVFEAWIAALAADPVSAFGGVIISNSTIDAATAKEIDSLFYEVLIATDYTTDALAILTAKSKRIVIKLKKYPLQIKTFKTLLNGVIQHDSDLAIEGEQQMTTVTQIAPSTSQLKDLVFANKVAKHLKSNTIVLAKNQQLLGMGCGQTSRVDACRQAIEKAHGFGISLEGCVMASDAFFPFPDCVEIAHKAGVVAVVQPGGSIKDQLSIDYCDENGLSMVMTGIRHFKH
jgi:phosphoribosylaminoimidazolecarboxamide formyltransferase / IMP cyclohydrolase